MATRSQRLSVLSQEDNLSGASAMAGLSAGVHVPLPQGVSWLRWRMETARDEAAGVRKAQDATLAAELGHGWAF